MNTTVEPFNDHDAREFCRALDQIVAEYLSSSDPLARLLLLAELRAAHNAAEVIEVDRARAEGTSWETVGRCLGISKQAADKRFADRPAPAAADRHEPVPPRPASKRA